ncbi:MAG: FHA domain-containing protein [Halobacteriales archaeon]|nr:FHA domain-containing protein [Halobacteriales archaeon]
MASGVPTNVLCEVCERYFDPFEEQGWCTYASCGNWQHPAFRMQTCTNCRREVQPTHRRREPGPDGDPGEDGDAATEENRDVVTGEDGDVVTGEDGDAATGEDGDRATGEEGSGRCCPGCETDLTDISLDRLSRCPICGLRLEPELVGPGIADPDAPVDVIPGIGTGYSRKLAGANVVTVGDLVRAAPGNLADEARIPERRIRAWIDRVGLDLSDTDTHGGPAGDDHDDDGGSRGDPSVEPTEIQRPFEALVLDVLDRKIRVRDGASVGTELRKAMAESGKPEDDWRLIHRKHVRIDFSDGACFLTRLGENSLEVNGRPVEKGDRVRIGDGDEVTFSGIVTARVRSDR